jgi:hypothetical protein
LRNLNACAGFEGRAFAVIERRVGDLDRSSLGTFFVLFRQPLDGDAAKIEPELRKLNLGAVEIRDAEGKPIS